MKLIFDIIKNGKDVPIKRNYHFDKVGGIIGRSDDCDCVLTDTKSYISSTHVNIEYKDGMYFIKDSSTNGTFLKHPYKKLPHNITIKINSNDIFIIGDYEIQARFMDNEYSNDAIINSDYNTNNNMPKTQAFNQLIPNDDDFLDDFALEDSNIMNNAFVIPDDDDDYDSNVMNMFKDDMNDNQANSHNTIETTILDGDFADERDNSNPLNQHLDIQSFNEIPIEEEPKTQGKSKIKEEPKTQEEVIQNKSTTKNIVSGATNNEKKTALSVEENNHSISIIEKKLGIELSSLSQEQRDYILTEISDIVINCLDGLKNSLNSKEKIKDDLLITNKNPAYKDANPIKMGQYVLNILQNRSPNDIKISEAVKKSFTELDIHNIALYKSSKNIINIAALKFSPKSLEHRFETNGDLNALMPKKYQMWDAYIKMFKKLNEDPDFGINLIEKEFSNEYNNISYSIKLTSI